MLHHFALLDKLQTLTEGGVHLWVTFGTGTNLRYLAAHDITRPFVNDTALALPAFHAFTGYDTVSCFHGRGKKKALNTWKWFSEVTPVFIVLSNAHGRNRRRVDDVIGVLEPTPTIPNPQHLITESGDSCGPHYRKSLIHARIGKVRM